MYPTIEMERLRPGSDLEDYLLLVNPQDNSIITDGSFLVVQNQQTTMMELAAFEEVAHHFNLMKLDNGDGTFSCIFRSTTEHASSAGSAEHASNAGSKGIKDWSYDETVRIIQLVIKYSDQVGPIKRFSTKKVMWKHITAELNNEFNLCVTPTQVENRYKTVYNKNKKRIEHNRTSGNDRMSTPYDAEFDLLAKKDHTIDPYLITQQGEIQRGSGASGSSSNSFTVAAVPEPSMDAETSWSSLNHDTSSNVEIQDADEEMLEGNGEKEKKTIKEKKKEKSDKKVEKEKKKKTNISLVTELYRNQCEFRAQEREENRKEKELAKAKAEKDKMERFQYAQERKDVRHQQKLEVLKDLVNVLKTKDEQDKS